MRWKRYGKGLVVGWLTDIGPTSLGECWTAVSYRLRPNDLLLTVTQRTLGQYDIDSTYAQCICFGWDKASIEFAVAPRLLLPIFNA